MDTIGQQMIDELAAWESETLWSANRDDNYDAFDDERLGEPVWPAWSPAAPYVAPKGRGRQARREPEVCAISPVTGWPTHLSQAEAERRDVRHADTFAGLGPVSRHGRRIKTTFPSASRSAPTQPHGAHTKGTTMPTFNESSGGGAEFVREHIPAGVYDAILAAVEDFDMPDAAAPGGKKPMVRWGFDVTSKRTGDVKRIEGVSSTAWGRGNAEKGMVPKAWRWVSTMMGEEPPLSGFCTDDLLGFPVKIKVSDKTDKTGGVYSFVEDVLPTAQAEF